jgi:hypothetical protein
MAKRKSSRLASHQNLEIYIILIFGEGTVKDVLLS